jgi:AAA family ATP:ADP antiporter
MNAAETTGGSVRPAVVAAAVLLAQQVAARATRDALFLSAFDVAALPTMTAAAAAASLLATFAASRAIARLSPARLLPAALAASAAAFAMEWALALAWPRPAAVAVFLHHAVLGAVLVSGFWSLVTERFDPHGAKHAMGRIGAGASLGGIVGGVVTWGAASRISPTTMIVLLAGSSLVGLASVRRLARRDRAAATPPLPAAAAAAPGRSGWATLRDVPYLRNLAALVGLTAFLDVVLDYLLAAAAVARFGAGGPLMSFFAMFHAVAGLLALVAQAALVRPLLMRAGPAWTLAAPALFTAAGAAAAAMAPHLLTLALLRGGHAVLRNSAFRSGYELLYTPVPGAQKRPAKVVIDVACERAGAIVGSGVVMLVLLAAPGASSQVLLALAALAGSVLLALTPLLRRGYVGALASSLRAGAGSLAEPEMVDPATLLTLASVHGHAAGLTSPSVLARASGGAGADPLLATIAELRSGDAQRIARVLDGGELDPRLVSHVIPLLARDSLFEVASASLRRSAARCTGQLVDALLDPHLPPVLRRRVARVLKGVPTQRAADGLLLALDDPRFDLRYRCAQALLRVRTQNPRIAVPAARVVEIAAREAAAAGESPRHLEHCFTLLGIVLEKGPLDIAYRALRSPDPGLRGTALEYLDNVVPAAVRERLLPRLGAPAPPAPSGRSAAEIRDDLLRSTAGLPRPGSSPR